MTYTEVCFKINPNNQIHEELLMAALEENGFDSFWQESDILKGYIISEEFKIENIQKVEKQFESLFTIKFTFSELPDKNWNEEWEKNFKSILIANKCLIKAPFHISSEKAEYEIIIEPKMSFGTGHHSTTALMIENILSLSLNNKTVLDIGCGTGILSILASKMSAANIVAVDNDIWAYENTCENVKNNNSTNIDVIHGNINNVPPSKFDIVLANINRNIILDDIEKYKFLMKDNGTLILSGFLIMDREVILQKAEELNLTSITFKEKEGWISEVLIKN